jgi:hypothetical protein
MNLKCLKSVGLIFALLISPLALAQTGNMPMMQSQQHQMMSQQNMNAMLAAWPEVSRKAAMEMMSKYGQPHEMTQSMLIWNNNGPWKRTIVYREPVQHNFPMPHQDVLEQFINYQAPAERFDELAAYDGSVIVERTKGEISARCDKEPMNFLALNLANDVSTGRKTVDEARAEYARTAMAFMKGQPMPYTQSLQFNVPEVSQGYPDMPFSQTTMAGMPSHGDMQSQGMMQRQSTTNWESQAAQTRNQNQTVIESHQHVRGFW